MLNIPKKRHIIYNKKSPDSLYIPTMKIAEGLSSEVYSATNIEKKENVAIKLINPITKPQQLELVLKEILIRKYLGSHNLLGLDDVIVVSNIDSNQSSLAHLDSMKIYLISEKMDSPLDALIKETTFTHQLIRTIFIQIIAAVSYLNSAGIVHQNIRPENILLNLNGAVKLCGFSFAKQMINTNVKANAKFNADQANYFISLYSAPEEILNPDILNEKVDIWSIGCIIAEMLIKSPLFLANNTNESIEMILEALGHQSKDDLSFITKQKFLKFVNKRNVFSNTIGEHIKIKWMSEQHKMQFDAEDNQLIDLLSKMLVLNPSKRCSIEDILNHPYFEHFRMFKLPSFDYRTNQFPFPNFANVSNEDLINFFMKEVQSFHTGLIS